ncbi:MAG: peptidoglycan bridge formation glycyltransferase FemA/FemB family protein [Patescibacteria group bacterium]
MSIDERSWNDAVRKHSVASGSFLQSYAWGEFQKSQGREIQRIIADDDGKTMVAQAVKLDAPLGIIYWLVPKGPFGDASPAFMRSTLVKELAQGVDYIRTEGVTRLPRTIEAKEMHPRTTRLLDLTKGYQVIFDEFNMRARYNTRLGKKKGVETNFVGLDRFDEFASLMSQTAERDAFSLHEMPYYRAMLETLAGADECDAKLAIATHEGVPLAATLTIDSFGTRTYLHGASGNQMRELKATHVLQDFVINDACEKGLVAYDFWGISPPGASEKHPWHGITKFKEGFGGYVYATDGTFDIPVHAGKYGLYRVARFVRSFFGKG